MTCEAFAATARAERLYSVTQIPNRAYEFVAGTALNDAGHLVGRAFPGGILPALGFYWSPDTGLLGMNGQEVFPRAVNNQGVVAGTWRSPEARATRVFLWDLDDRTARDVGDFTVVGDVNDAGQLALRFESRGSP